MRDSRQIIFFKNEGPSTACVDIENGPHQNWLPKSVVLKLFSLLCPWKYLLNLQLTSNKNLIKARIKVLFIDETTKRNVYHLRLCVSLTLNKQDSHMFFCVKLPSVN